MQKDNVIYFGYGSVGVGSNNLQLVLNIIKPPVELGSKIDIKNKIALDDNNTQIEVLNTIYIDVINNPINIFDEIKKAKNKEIAQIEISNYILDFSNYNIKSFDSFDIHLKLIMSRYCSLLAC